jgi:hypothetical protein
MPHSGKMKRFDCNAEGSVIAEQFGVRRRTAGGDLDLYFAHGI